MKIDSKEYQKLLLESELKVVNTPMYIVYNGNLYQLVDESIPILDTQQVVLGEKIERY